MADDSQTESELETALNRRNLLKIAGVAGVPAIAGCASEDGGDGNGTDGGDGNGTDGGDGNGTDGGDGAGNAPIREEFHGRMKSVLPSEAGFNPFNPKDRAGFVGNVTFDPLAYRGRGSVPVPIVAKGWETPEELSEGTTVTVHLQDDPPYTWHNGDEVTSRDIVTMYSLGKHFNWPIWDYISAVEMAGDYSVDFTISTTVAKTILINNMINDQAVNIKHSVFKGALEAIQDASSDEERDQAKNELINRHIGIGDVVGTGAFYPTDSTSKKLFMERYEDYVGPAEREGLSMPEGGLEYEYETVDFDIPNFKKYVGIYAPEDQGQSIIRSKTLHGTRVEPQISGSDVPDVYEYRPFRNSLGESYGFNFQHELFGKREVRQAMAYIVNRAEVVNAMNPSGRSEETLNRETPDSQTGMADWDAKEWLGDIYEKLPKYNNGKNTEEKLQKAEELLKSVGFSKDGDTWMKPDGSPWTPTIKTQPGWKKSMSPTVSILKRFGINANLTIEEGGVFFGQTIPSHNFSSMGYIWTSSSGRRSPHPWFYYDWALASQTTNNTQPALQIPPEVEVPKTIGDPEDSQTRTVNIPKRVEELGKPLAEDERKEIVAELAWTYNQLMPQIQLRNHTVHTALHEDFVWPEKGSKIDFPVQWDSQQIALGEMRAKMEGE
jgi:peptide/nickel transport system substrate-binding protein